MDSFRTEMMKGKTAAARDAKALKALESVQKGGNLNHFLAEKGLTTEVKASRKAELIRRKAELTRLKLIEADTIKDPQVRAEAREAQITEVKLFLDRLGVFKNPKLVEMINKGKWGALRSALGEAIARETLAADYAGSKGAQVFGNLEVVRKVSFKTVAEYKASDPAKADPGKLRYKNGKIWGEVISEIDVLVAEPTGKGGKLKPAEIAEVKTRDGGSSTGAKAQAQAAEKVVRLDLIRTSPKGDVVLVNRSGTRKLGSDITGRFDFSSADTTKATTVGSAGKKGFTRELPFSNDILFEVAQSIAKKGLPSKKPQTIPPKSSPGADPDKDKDTKATK